MTSIKFDRAFTNTYNSRKRNARWFGKNSKNLMFMRTRIVYNILYDTYLLTVFIVKIQEFQDFFRIKYKHRMTSNT